MRPTTCTLGLALATAAAALSSTPTAQAAEPGTEPTPTAFGQPIAIGAYTLGGFGAYDAAGIGGRARFEFWQRHAGLDLFGEAWAVDWPGGGSRRDIPIGFNLYAPVALGKHVRLRGMAGMCAVFSVITPSEQGAPPANDVLFGVHGGGGLEVEVAGPFVWFLDAQAIWYVGHDRTSQSWSGAVSGAFAQSVVFQPSTGLMVAFGR